MRTPITIIRWAADEVTEYEQQQANIEAMATARLTAILIQIAHGFSGSKRAAPEVKIQDFLPFPNWSPDKTQSDGPDEHTKYVLAQLGKHQQLPLHVLTALLTPSRREP